MSKTRRAKAGRAFWAQMQKSPRHQRYSSRLMRVKVGPPAMDQNILGAALAAAEAIHASVQIIPNIKGNTKPESPERTEKLELSVQPEVKPEAPEGTKEERR